MFFVKFFNSGPGKQWLQIHRHVLTVGYMNGYNQKGSYILLLTVHVSSSKLWILFISARIQISQFQVVEKWKYFHNLMFKHTLNSNNSDIFAHWKYFKRLQTCLVIEWLMKNHHGINYSEPMLIKCWPTVYNADPSLNQYYMVLTSWVCLK